MEMRNEIVKLQDEFCTVAGDITRELYDLAFVVKENIDKGLVWAADPGDPNNQDVIAFTTADDKGYWLIEITREMIRVDTGNEEKILNIDLSGPEGVRMYGFGLEDIPFLRSGPELIKKLEAVYHSALREYLKRISQQPKGPVVILPGQVDS